MVSGHAKASVDGIVLAETDQWEEVEGNVYFPPTAIDEQYFQPNDKTTHCWWKGDARYYDVVVDGETNAAAAWYYADPLEKAAHIKDHVAFWKGVTVER